MEKINYHGWPESIRLANEAIELVALTVVGPRIMRLAFLGGQNMLDEIAETSGKIGPPDKWTIYGGHRLWHAPEIAGRTDAPDSDPMEMVRWEKDTLSLLAKTEKPTGIQKEMRITLAAGSSTAVKVDHILTNHNLWPVELAPWGLTVVSPGGRVILPQEPFQGHGEKGNFLPSRPLVLWPYTDMSDLRWRWGKSYIQLYADESLANPQKIGIYNSQGWGAYERELGGDLLVVYTQPDARGASSYPDYGSNFEAYTAGNFQELETLGPTARLEPGQEVGHTEYWMLYKAACLPDIDEELEQCLPALIAEGHAAIQASFFIKKLHPNEQPEQVPGPYRIPQLPAE